MAINIALSATSGADANGQAMNTVTAVLTNNGTYISGRSLTFMITGSDTAFFTNNSNSVTDDTNTLGEVVVSLRDTVAETVNILCFTSDAPENMETTSTVFGGSTPVTDNIALTVLKDNSIDDGEDTNKISVTTYSNTTPVPNESVTVRVNNGALFFNGEDTATLVTKDNGSASVEFTNTLPGDVTFRALLPDDISVTASVTTTFTSSDEDKEPEVSLRVIHDNASANGSSVNTVQAIVLDKNTGTPLSAFDVELQVTGSARFSENNSDEIIVPTNTEGSVVLNLIDTAVESVTVTATAGDSSDSVSLNFQEDYSALEITSVYNRNKTFPTGGPSTAWPDAEFMLEVAGGSGDYKWEIDARNMSITPESTNRSRIRFGVESPGSNPVTITVTDNVTHDVVSYTFSIEAFFIEYGKPKFYVEMLIIGFKHCPTPQELLSLYDDWGNMYNYDGWVIDEWWGWYWTSDANIVAQTTVRLVNGEISTDWDQIYACDYSRVIRS